MVLLKAIRDRRPRRKGDPDWTFVVGTRPEYLAISTAGPRSFDGQHPLWGEADKHKGNMMFRGLDWADVRAVLGKLYEGRRAEGCFAPHEGAFKFYTSPP